MVGAGCLAAAPIRLPVQMAPSINIISHFKGGSVRAGSFKGTLALDVSGFPAGLRRVAGGASPGRDSGFCLGAFTLTGTPGNHWVIGHTQGSIPLRGPGGRTLMAACDTLMLAPALAPVFPPGGRGASTTAPQYFGLTVQVKEAGQVPPGTYAGQLCLWVTDTSTGQTGTGTFSITVNIDETPISLSKGSDLSFGDLLSGLGSGTVVLGPGGSRTATGGVGLASSRPVGAASLQVTGTEHAAYTITLPASAALKGSNGQSLTVDHFTSSPSRTGTLDATGQQLLNVGATLQVPANQAAGTYSGTFRVTVAYD